MNIKGNNIIKKYKIENFNADENEKLDLKNDNKLIFSSGTPQLSHGKHQWVALYNPKNSNSIIYVESICSVNFSSEPIIQSQFLNPKIDYEGFKYMYGVSNSLVCNITSSGVVIFYQGNENLLFHNEANSLRVLQPFYTDISQKQGNIIIPPGKSILTLLNSISQYEPSCAISYTWWEE
jgi:hypothetical protein